MNKLATAFALVLFALVSFGCCCKQECPIIQDGIYVDGRIHEDFDERYLDWMKDPSQIKEYEALMGKKVDAYLPNLPEDGRVEVPRYWTSSGEHTLALEQAAENLDKVVEEISEGQLSTFDGSESDVTYVIIRGVEYCIYGAQLYLAVDTSGGSAEGDGDPGIYTPLSCPMPVDGPIEMDARFWVYVVLKTTPRDPRGRS